jgi:RNA polymerase sigma-70 factor (ECF subfamily)
MQEIVIDPRGDDLSGSLAAARPAAVSAQEDEDAALVRRCRAGDLDSFGGLVARHEKRVRSLVARVLGAGVSPDDVDDVVQDVFVQAWHALPRFRGEARFSTWLYRIATNMAIKHWHRGKRDRQVVSEEDLPETVRGALADSGLEPSDEVERRARDRALRAAIDALPEKQRAAVLLHYFEEYSCEQIAAMAGCSVGTVWSRLHYACRKLRGRLGWLEQP